MIINNKKLSRNYSRFFSYKSGVIFSHYALFIAMTSMKFIRAKSNENILSPDISQEIFVYRVNYMLNLDMYHVPIFMHPAMHDVLYVFNNYIRRSVPDNGRKLLQFVHSRQVNIAW